jgi:hypothetical protein
LFEVGGAEVAEVAAGDEGEVGEVVGGVGGGAEFLSADVLGRVRVSAERVALIEEKLWR